MDSNLAARMNASIITNQCLFSLGGCCQPRAQLWNQPPPRCLLQVTISPYHHPHHHAIKCNIQFSTIAITIPLPCYHNAQAITSHHIMLNTISPKVHCNPHQHHHICISLSSLEAAECPKALERQRQEAQVLGEATHTTCRLSDCL